MPLSSNNSERSSSPEIGGSLLLAVALACVERLWHVFPCKPRTKQPSTLNGFKDATLDELRIREWWKRWPDANVAIATGPSGLCVVDIDHGIDNYAKLTDFMSSKGLTHTRAVRTGRRDGYGVQLYYEGEGLKSVPWKDGEVSGDIRCATGYVMAAGSIHPDSGEPYTVLYDASSLPSVPAYVRTLKPERGAGVPDDGAPISESRNNALTSIAGKLRNAGLSAAALEVALLQVNADRCVPPLPEEEVQRIAANASKWELPETQPEVVLGQDEPKPLVDWRTRYHTLDELESVKPATFMVEQILHQDSIVGLAGYAGDRKSIVSLNLASACVTGKPFMGRFAVTNPPKRVLYLCPEMGLRELAERVRGLEMAAYVGKTLFFRTLDKTGDLRLPDMAREELDGALVILDTAIRFLEGSENDPQDMARFAEQLFRLRSAGATVWVLFHSSKASAGQDLTLQNAVRGSSELAAMLSACWATRLLDPQDRFGSNSRLFPLKTREFEAFPFEFAVERANAACTIVGEPAPEAVLRNRKDVEAETLLRQIVEAEPTLGVGKIRERLKAAGHGKGQTWVIRVLALVRGMGVETTA